MDNKEPKGFKGATMLIFLLFLLVSISLVNISYSDDPCSAAIRYGYGVGYKSGVGDRENGYKSEAEKYYNLPLFQAGLKIVKEELKTKYDTYFNEYEFDKCFKKGFLNGYKDGY